MRVYKHEVTIDLFGIASKFVVCMKNNFQQLIFYIYNEYVSKYVAKPYILYYIHETVTLPIT